MEKKTKTKTLKPFTAKEWFEHEQNVLRVSFNNPVYINLMTRAAGFIKVRLNPQSYIELGPGVGVLLNEMSNSLGASKCKGYDLSKYHIEEYKKQTGKNNMYCEDFSKLKEPLVADVITSIEVFEHMKDEDIEATLKNCKCKYFVFSSTSEKDPDFDVQWGHINVKTQSEWISLLKKYGFELYQNWTTPTGWTKVFTTLEFY